MQIGKQVVSVVLMLALGYSSALAQAPDAKLAAKVHAKLERIFDGGGRAKVELKDGRKFQGNIAELAADKFVLADGATSNTFSYSEVKKVSGFGPSPNSRRWVGLAFLGGLLGLTFALAATQTR